MLYAVCCMMYDGVLYCTYRDRILSRLGTSDDMENNLSSFATEMNETAYLLANNTERSLIIIDELGRGTSTIDAVCLAIAVVEAIAESTSFCLFITHLPQV